MSKEADKIRQCASQCGQIEKPNREHAQVIRTDNLKALSKKFLEHDIEWRVQQAGGGNGKAWALIIPYITSRAIMQRLDDVVGPGNWKNEYKPSPCNTGYLCGISILINGEWVTKWDGSETTGAGSIDSVKSTISAATKRAGVQWGIGRYLYQFDPQFAICELCDSRYQTKPGYTYQKVKIKGGADIGIQWKPKPLDRWALPVTDKDIRDQIERLESAEILAELKMEWRNAYNLATSENDHGMLEQFQAVKDAAKARIEQSTKDAVKNDVKAFVDKYKDRFKTAKNETVLSNAYTDAKKLAMDRYQSDTLKAVNAELKEAKESKLKTLESGNYE